MITPTWQLHTPIDAIIFDCDGTLSAQEGVDELAQQNGVGDRVKALTADAMGKTGMSLALYEKRLALIQPTLAQVIAQGKEYFVHRTPHIEQIIALLQRLNKSVYIVSAGLYPAVALFGELLQIPQTNIIAVDITFDGNGNFSNFDHSSPLTTRDGKRLIVNELKMQYPALLYVGDGLNDLATYDLVTRFVGYGGAYYRANIEALCEFYIKTASMLPLLPLALTKDESAKLLPEELAMYKEGMQGL